MRTGTGQAEARSFGLGLSERTVYFHRVLGVPLGSGRDAIKRAYRTQARLYHPDVNPAGQERMRLLNEAYQHLQRVVI